jgi:hypothetical protein
MHGFVAPPWAEPATNPALRTRYKPRIGDPPQIAALGTRHKPPHWGPANKRSLPITFRLQIAVLRSLVPYLHLAILRFTLRWTTSR